MIQLISKLSGSLVLAVMIAPLTAAADNMDDTATAIREGMCAASVVTCVAITTTGTTTAGSGVPSGHSR